MWTDPPETQAEYAAHISRLARYNARATYALTTSLWITLSSALLSAPYNTYVMLVAASVSIAAALAVTILSSEIEFSTPPSPRQ